MVKPRYQLLVDWNNDGDFLDTGEDVSARVARLEWQRGRDNASTLTGRSISGKLTAGPRASIPMLRCRQSGSNQCCGGASAVV